MSTDSFPAKGSSTDSGSDGVADEIRYICTEKNGGLLGYFTFFCAFLLDFIESKPFSYQHFRLFQQTLLNFSQSFRKISNPKSQHSCHPYLKIIGHENSGKKKEQDN
jgi:hypothetical protein